MQLQLPIFPANTKLINSSIGTYQDGQLVYYLHNGAPIFCHHIESMNNYRYILANLVQSKLCSCSEISKALGVSSRNIERYAKKLRENGMESFFNQEDHRGECYKMKDSTLIKAQGLLDAGNSQLKTAKELGLSESSIRYHLKNGNLKKKPA